MRAGNLLTARTNLRLGYAGVVRMLRRDFLACPLLLFVSPLRQDRKAILQQWTKEEKAARSARVGNSLADAGFQVKGINQAAAMKIAKLLYKPHAGAEFGDVLKEWNVCYDAGYVPVIWYTMDKAGEPKEWRVLREEEANRHKLPSSQIARCADRLCACVDYDELVYKSRMIEKALNELFGRKYGVRITVQLTE